jgi:hypothetical protein
VSGGLGGQMLAFVEGTGSYTSMEICTILSARRYVGMNHSSSIVQRLRVVPLCRPVPSGQFGEVETATSHKASIFSHCESFGRNHRHRLGHRADHNIHQVMCNVFREVSDLPSSFRQGVKDRSMCLRCECPYCSVHDLESQVQSHGK